MEFVRACKEILKTENINIKNILSTDNMRSFYQLMLREAQYRNLTHKKNNKLEIDYNELVELVYDIKKKGGKKLKTYNKNVKMLQSTFGYKEFAIRTDGITDKQYIKKLEQELKSCQLEYNQIKLEYDKVNNKLKNIREYCIIDQNICLN